MGYICWIGCCSYINEQQSFLVNCCTYVCKSSRTSMQNLLLAIHLRLIYWIKFMFFLNLRLIYEIIQNKQVIDLIFCNILALSHWKLTKITQGKCLLNWFSSTEVHYFFLLAYHKIEYVHNMSKRSVYIYGDQSKSLPLSR